MMAACLWQDVHKTAVTSLQKVSLLLQFLKAVSYAGMCGFCEQTAYLCYRSIQTCWMHMQVAGLPFSVLCATPLDCLSAGSSL